MNTLVTVSATNNNDNYTTKVTGSTHSLIADEPGSLGGKNEGPTPGEYLCMSLASCKAITLRMYIQRKQWNIKNIEVKVSLEKHESQGSPIHIFHAEVMVDESTPFEQKERLLYIAKACPISKLLAKQNTIETKVVNQFTL